MLGEKTELKLNFASSVGVSHTGDYKREISIDSIQGKPS